MLTNGMPARMQKMEQRKRNFPWKLQLINIWQHIIV